MILRIVKPYSPFFSCSYCSRPLGYWSNEVNRRIFFEQLGEKLGFKSFEQWHQIGRDLIDSGGGRGLMSIYANSPLKALKAIYPEYDWIGWKLNSAPKSYWKSKRERRAFFDWMKQELGYNSLEDLYKIDYDQITSFGSVGFISIYDRSPLKALKHTFPEYDWIGWKLKCTPKNFWNSQKERRTFFDWIGEKLGYVTFEDWYRVDHNLISALGGGGLIHTYDHSPLKALKSIYPEYDWIGWKLKSTPNNFWNVIEERRRFFDSVGDQLGYHSLEDWYRIDHAVLSALGGGGLMSIYNGSPFKALKSTYPERDWIGWKLKRTPINFWNNKKEHRVFFDWMGERLGYVSYHDWYRIGLDVICSMGGKRLMNFYNGSPLNALKAIYPEHDWTPKFTWKKSQHVLYKKINEMFPAVKIFEDYNHSFLRYSEKTCMQFDVFVPQLSLGFEYQGFQHYQCHFLHSPLQHRKLLDLEKKRLCRKAGITLIEIPHYLGPVNEELVKKEILKYRSDMLNCLT